MERSPSLSDASVTRSPCIHPTCPFVHNLTTNRRQGFPSYRFLHTLQKYQFRDYLSLALNPITIHL